MANNIVYQHVQVDGTGVDQSPTVSSQNAGLGVESNNPALQKLPVSDQQIAGFELSGVPGMQAVPLSNEQCQLAGTYPSHESHQFLLPNQQVMSTEALAYRSAMHQSSILNKRKNPMEPVSINTVPQESLMPNKRLAQIGHRSVLQEVSSPNNRPAKMQSKSNTPESRPLPAPNKRGAQSEPRSGKSGSHQISVTKYQTKMQTSPRVQTDSDESVRSKMRESLVGALSLVSCTSDKPTRARLSSHGEAMASSMQSDDTHPGKPGISASEEDADVQDGQGQLETPSNVNTGQTLHALNCGGTEYELCKMHDEDISFAENFIVKDELLQGNGLSWVLDSYPEIAEKDINSNENQSFGQGKNQRNENFQSPESLASKIEAELYKLYGGVNKKYKEKARSLLFNLKDHNNPELRGRVVTGEIPPERLCSMTAEELASKELSQWRIAKAEELAQMVVLPDTEIDVRRLVKKTHKGEYQVEVEHENGDSIDIPLKARSVTALQSTKKTVSFASNSEESNDGVDVTGERSKVENQDELCTITIPPSKGSDLKQGLMVDDVMNETYDLPSIVSLDEFMQSLDSEPPFENMSAAAVTPPPISDRDDSDRSGCKGANASPISSESIKMHPVGVYPDKPNDVYASKHASNSNKNLGSIRGVLKERTSLVPMGEHIWEGSVQLSIEASCSIIGIFKCGEKAPTKEWPPRLEVKGRVRLNAFEKFLQELPMSRSRAVMVAYFVCQAESSDGERASVQKAVDSYIMDERVGFAEPGPGIELYLCPTHVKTFELLDKILSKVHMQELSVIENGFIGIVVWRKFTCTASPNSSLGKHGSKRNHSSRRRQEKYAKMDDKIIPTSKTSTSVEQLHSVPIPLPNEEDDADVPPGFGPSVGRDDDLPEFDFSSDSGKQQYSNPIPSLGPGVSSTHERQVTLAERMRELVHKYGQNKSDVPSDDDDIPEWQPQIPHQRPMLRQHLTSYQRIPVSMVASPVRSAQHLDSRLLNMVPHSMHQSLLPAVHSVSHGVRPSTGQFYELPHHGLRQPCTQWRRDAPGGGS